MDTMIQSEIATVVVLVASGEPEKALVQPEAWPSQPLVDCCLLTVSNFILLVQSNGSLFSHSANIHGAAVPCQTLLPGGAWN